MLKQNEAEINIQIFHAHGSEGLRLLILHIWIYILNAIRIKIPAVFYYRARWDDPTLHTEMQRSQNGQKILKKNNKVKGLTAHDFRNYSKAVFIIRFLTEKSLLAPTWVSGIQSGVHKYQIKYLRSCWRSLTTLSRGRCFPTKSP